METLWGTKNMNSKSKHQIQFEKGEMKKRQKVKALHGGNWHDFIMYLIELSEVENRK